MALGNRLIAPPIDEDSARRPFAAGVEFIAEVAGQLGVRLRKVRDA
jgi:hypothetical protein